MELLVTENRPETGLEKSILNTLEIVESVEKWSSWSPKTGPRTGLEKSILNTLEIVESVEKWSSWSPKTSSRNGAVKPQHGKAGKARGLVSRSFRFFHAFHDFQGVQNRFWNQVLGPVFGVQELHFSMLS